MNTATYNKDFHRTVKKAEIPSVLQKCSIKM